MAALRHYGMGKVFNQGVRAIDVGLGPLRSFTLEGGRQVLDQARRAAPTPLMARVDVYAMVDIDDTIIEVYGSDKADSSYRYSGVRG